MRKTAYMAIGLAAAAAIVVPFVGCGKSAGIADPVATVDGVAIPSSEFIQMVSLQGSQVLSNRIEEQIVLNWAKDENVMPTDEQKNRQIESLKRDGSYDDQVKLVGEDAVAREVNYTLARANLYKKFGKVDDAEVKQAYDMMKNATYVHGPRKRMAVIMNWDKARLEEAAKKAGSGDDIDKLACEYCESGLLRGSMATRVWDDDQRLPKDIQNACKSLAVGKVSAILPLGPANGPTSEYVFVKAIQEQPQTNIPFEKVKADIADYVAYQKSLSPYDTSSFQDKFKERKQKADIKINAEQLAGALASIKNPPAPAPPMPTMPPSAVKPAKPAAKPGK